MSRANSGRFGGRFGVKDPGCHSYFTQATNGMLKVHVYRYGALVALCGAALPRRFGDDEKPSGPRFFDCPGCAERQ